MFGFQLLMLLVFKMQNLALFGALLFYIGMKNSMPRKQLKKKAPKAKKYLRRNLKPAPSSNSSDGWGLREHL